MDLVVKLEGETLRRLLVTSTRHRVPPAKVAARAIEDLYWLIDRLSDAQKRELLARAAAAGAAVFES